MKCLREYRKPIVLVAATALIAVSTPIPPAHAALVATDHIVTAAQGSARAKLNAFLSRKDVQTQMEALGVSPAEAKARVASLSDEEVAKIQGRLGNMPAGQEFGALVGAAVLIFLVLLITDLLGLTHVFGFTNKGSLKTSH